MEPSREGIPPADVVGRGAATWNSSGVKHGTGFLRCGQDDAKKF
jgi:hypothetical protein